MFLNKNHKFLEISKSLSWTSKIPQFGYEYITAVRCTRERRQMRKLETVAISHNFNLGAGGVFVPLQEQIAEKTLTKAIMFVK